MKGQTNAWLKEIISGEKISITLTTNQSSHTDLMGAVITVSYAGNLTEYTWEGSAIQTVIPPMTDYTVSYSDVNGYSTPEPFSGKAIDGRVSEVIGIYNTEVVTVNVSAEEGEVSGYEIQISKVTEKMAHIPTGYTELEYIQSNGNQYIDTGIVGQSGISMELDMSFVSIPSDATVVGSRTSSNRFYLAHYYQYWAYGYGNYYQTSKTASTGTRYTVNSVLKSGTQSMSINGSSAANATSSTTYNTGYNLYVCACNNAGTASYHCSVKIYKLKLYNNGVLVRDYIPVKNNSGVAGLLDKVENKFYASGSSTAFTAGTVVGEITEEGIITEYETLYTQTTPSATYKIPYDTSYTIKASDASGYTTPSEQSFTASQPTRNVAMVYEEEKFGVLIYDIDGKLTYPDNWNSANNSKAVGVAILTDKCKFVVAKEDVSPNYLYWGGYRIEISTLTNYTSSTNAATDFDGVNNTSKIIAAIGNGNDGYRNGTAAGDCAAYTFPNGEKGYLGAAGEWNVARQNKDALNSALTLIGGSTMKESAYWTSTEYSSSNAYYQWFNSQNYLLAIDKNYNEFHVRAFAPLHS